MQIKIGRELEKNAPFILDLPTLIDTRMLVQSNSGGGKSHGLRKILEETHGKVQQIVLDIEGEFATLREKYDYLLVGKGGDLPIHIKTAEVLAKKLLELNVSTIIDLYELKQHERILFVKRFLESMINAPKELWHPCLVIVDESHQFCPEHGKSESMSAVIDLMTRGRKRGFCGILATQRLSKLHKDAAAEANCKLIGRTGLDVDMKRASEELGFTTKADMLSLRDLEPGEFFAFGPALSKKIIKVKIGAVKTTHPKVGSRTLLTTPPPTERMKKMLAKLTDLPKEAEEELRTIQNYKAKVHELKIQLSKTAKTEIKPIIDKKAIQTAYEQGTRDGQNKSAKGFIESVDKLDKAQKRAFQTLCDTITGFLKQGDKIKDIIQNTNQLIQRNSPVVVLNDNTCKVNWTSNPNHGVSKKFDKLPDIILAKTMRGELITTTKDTTPIYAQYAQEDQSKTLYAGAIRMLRYLAQHHPKPLTKAQIGVLAGISSKTGTFRSYISSLNRAGLIEVQGDQCTITSQGIERAGDFEPLPTDQENLLDYWAKKFYKGAGEMLRVLAENYPRSISKEELGSAVGIDSTTGTFRSYLSTLNRAGLIQIQGQTVTATKELFPEE